MREPFPNGFDILDLKAIVGCCFERCLTHFAKVQIGIKSDLFKSKTICLCGQFLLINYSSACERVPYGSLASRT